MAFKISLSFLEMIDIVEKSLKSSEWEFMRKLGSINYMWYRADLLLDTLKTWANSSNTIKNLSQEISNATRNMYKLEPFLRAGYSLFNLSVQILNNSKGIPSVDSRENNTVRSFLWGIQNSIVADIAFSDYFKVSDNVTDNNFNLQQISGAFSFLSGVKLEADTYEKFSQLMVIFVIVINFYFFI